MKRHFLLTVLAVMVNVQVYTMVLTPDMLVANAHRESIVPNQEQALQPQEPKTVQYYVQRQAEIIRVNSHAPRWKMRVVLAGAVILFGAQYARKHSVSVEAVMKSVTDNPAVQAVSNIKNDVVERVQSIPGSQFVIDRCKDSATTLLTNWVMQYMSTKDEKASFVAALLAYLNKHTDLGQSLESGFIKNMHTEDAIQKNTTQILECFIRNSLHVAAYMYYYHHHVEKKCDPMQKKLARDIYIQNMIRFIEDLKRIKSSSCPSAVLVTTIDIEGEKISQLNLLQSSFLDIIKGFIEHGA